MSNPAPIDRIVEAAFDKVLRRTTVKNYWTPTEVLREALAHAGLGTMIREMASFGSTTPEGPWGLDKIVLSHVRERIGVLQRVRDANGFREYESFAVPGQHERRYMRLSGMTSANLRAAMEQARTQERDYHTKGEGYNILLGVLETLGADATVADAMPTALPLIVAYRAKSA